MDNPLRDNSGRSGNLLKAYGILIASTIAMMLINLITIYKLAYEQDESFTGTSNLDLTFISTGVVRSIQRIYFVVAIVYDVIYFLWMRRAYANLTRSGRITTRYLDGMAVGAWFIPIANFIIPYIMIREIWFGTQRANGRFETEKKATILNWWWFFWVVRTILAYSSFFVAKNSENYLLKKTQLYSAEEIFSIIVCILGIIIITRIRKMEMLLYNSFSVEEQEHEDHLREFENV